MILTTVFSYVGACVFLVAGLAVIRPIKDEIDRLSAPKGDPK